MPCNNCLDAPFLDILPQPRSRWCTRMERACREPTLTTHNRYRKKGAGARGPLCLRVQPQTCSPFYHSANHSASRAIFPKWCHCNVHYQIYIILATVLPGPSVHGLFVVFTQKCSLTGLSIATCALELFETPHKDVDHTIVQHVPNHALQIVKGVRSLSQG